MTINYVFIFRNGQIKERKFKITIRNDQQLLNDQKLYKIQVSFIFINILIFDYPQMEAEKPHQNNPQKESPFKLYKGDFEDLFLKVEKLPKSLVNDIISWVDLKGFKGFLYHNIFEWFHEEKERINETAKSSHKVIDNLLVENIPSELIEVYMQLLLKSKSKIEKQLNSAEADALFKYIPTELIIDYVELYQIKLTDKEKENIIFELLGDKKRSLDKIDRLPIIFRDKEKYSDLLINRLSKIGRHDIAGVLIKKYNLPLKNYEGIQVSLIENSARSMPHWEKQKFTWDVLQQVYLLYPSAIAACIKKLSKQKRSKQLTIGFASIIHRIPQVIKFLPNEIKHKLKEIKEILPNKLRTDKFQPSDPKAYFSLYQFGITEKDVVWVDEKNFEEAVGELFKSHIIGIDTESTVARTTLSTSFQLLSIIQIFNESKVFIFDAMIFKKNPIKSEIIDDFFKNEKNIVVGHTLEADLNEDVTKILGFQGKVMCQKIDICPIFKNCYPGKRAGLAYIAEVVLGKQICKAYTLTNWDRRPLLRNQIHYSALDALIVIKIWDVLKNHENAKLIPEKKSNATKQNRQKKK